MILEINISTKIVIFTFIILYFISAYILWLSSSTIPLYDELDLIEYCFGTKEITVSWLWSPHNEHRILLQKIVYLLLCNVSNVDYRVMNIFSLTFLSFCGIFTLKSLYLTGKKVSWLDVTILLLTATAVQNFNTLGWSFQIGFTLPLFLIFMTSMFFINYLTKPRSPYLLYISLGMLSLALCGSVSYHYLSIMVLFFVYLLWGFNKQYKADKYIYISIASLISAVFIVLLNFVNYSPPLRDKPEKMSELLNTSLQFIISGWGYRPTVGVSYNQIIMSIMIFLIFLSFVLIIFNIISNKEKRLIYIFIACLICSHLLLSLVVGYTRSWTTITAHYTTLAMPLIIYIYMVLSLNDNTRIKIILFILLLLLCKVQYDNSIAYSGWITSMIHHRERDISLVKQGATPAEIARLYAVYDTNPEFNEEKLTDGLVLMERENAGLFKYK